MPMGYDPKGRTVQPTYAVTTTGTDQLFIPTTGYGDNPDSGSVAQRRTQSMNNGGQADVITDTGEYAVDFAG